MTDCLHVKSTSRRWTARASIAVLCSVAPVSTATAVNLSPLRDAKFKYLCIDLDSIRAEATGWTMYSQTYCSGTYGDRPAPFLHYAVRCSEYLSSGSISLQFYTSRWEPKQADRIDRLSIQLVCGG
jgi:hypothetical protein